MPGGRHGFGRNTPTSVGKTKRARRVEVTQEKHPHERGEDLLPVTFGRPATETPPRAWGRPGARNGQPRCCRNTPTSVGKTHTAFLTWPAVRKHPHERGEDLMSVPLFLALAETPPRAWGRRGIWRKGQRQQGNTPTSVGKTPPNCNFHRYLQKHPHERGEDGYKNTW